MPPTVAPSLARYLASPLTVGEPDVAGPLAVFPVFGPAPQRRFRAFAQLAGKGVTVRERDGGASVNDLTVVNATDVDVLLYDGEEVAGAQQDRTFDVSVLVGARSTLDVPVSCVEAGRWDGSRGGEAFTPSPQAAFPELRRAKSRRVRERVAAGLDARAVQAEVWQTVERKHARHGSHSATSAMRDVFDGRRAQLGELCDAIRPHDGQVGMLAAIGGRFTVLDHASVPQAFAALRAPLVRGYALDALEIVDAAPAPAPSLDAAATWLERVCVARITERDGIGLGREARFADGAVGGAALVCGGELVQLSAFAEDDAAPSATRIRRPSRRR